MNTSYLYTWICFPWKWRYALYTSYFIFGAVTTVWWDHVVNVSTFHGTTRRSPRIYSPLVCRLSYVGASVRSCGILRDPAGSCGILRDPAGSCGILRDPAGTCGNLREPAGTCGNLRDPVGFCGILWFVVLHAVWLGAPTGWVQECRRQESDGAFKSQCCHADTTSRPQTQHVIATDVICLPGNILHPPTQPT